MGIVKYEAIRWFSALCSFYLASNPPWKLVKIYLAAFPSGFHPIGRHIDDCLGAGIGEMKIQGEDWISRLYLQPRKVSFLICFLICSFIPPHMSWPTIYQPIPPIPITSAHMTLRYSFHNYRLTNLSKYQNKKCVEGKTHLVDSYLSHKYMEYR